MVGRTVLHYQFLELLGSGGMGEIYKAHDTRLNRFVAIKILTTSAAGDPDRRRRFIQEAQAASALNHPNIITIHDIVSEGNTEFMVMEYVTGKTLVDLIPKDGLRESQVLKFSVQMADALQAAHNAGIVHRDLKPGNVMVTESGLVKILDFGLAKLTDRNPLTSLAGNLDITVTMADAPLTVEGSIIGTVSYMSPEQAQGKKVDTRSDIFSFGVVLYEMVTGARAFEGDSALTTLSSILRDEARPVADFAPDSAPQLEMVIRRCLKKIPDERWQTMQDVQMALAALKHESDSGMLHRARLSEPTVPPPLPASVGGANLKSGPSPVLVAVLGGTLALATIAGGTLWWNKRHKPPAPVEAAAVAAPEPAAPAAPDPPPNPEAAADEPMTNDQIIQMVEAKVSQNQIIAQIRDSKATHFVITPAELIKLKSAGVPDNIVDLMRNPKRAAFAGTLPPTNPAPKPPPQTPAPAATQTTPPPATAAPTPPPPQPVVVQTPPPPPSATTASTPSPTTPSTTPVTIKDGTPFAIVLAEDIPSTVEEGRPLRFTVTTDVRVGDKLLIAKGAVVSGEIAEAKKKVLGMGGKLTLKLKQADAVDGRKLNIRALPVARTDGSYRAVAVDGAKPKKDMAASAGTEYYAYIEGDQTVFARK